MGAAQLPSHFPCWCQATYSWGGETKKDLGFIEGDLIEALNAGDGLWWMGRLRRDPRVIGLFPSNFVKVLGEGFQPAPNNRHVSLSTQSSKPSPSSTVKSKSVFRPYASMKTAQAPTSSLKKQLASASTAAPKPEAEPRIPAPPPRRMHSKQPSQASSPHPAARMSTSASPSPTPLYQRTVGSAAYRTTPPQPEYRAASPAPSHRVPSPAPSRPHSPLPASYHDGSAYPQLLPSSRQPSPDPYQQQYYSGSSTPAAPPFGYSQSYPAPSPAPQDDESDSDAPPPPPPAHRVAYQPSRAPSTTFHDQRNSYPQSGNHTPVAPSPSGTGSHMTPSPLRDAMNDVMSSLHDMSVSQDSSELQYHAATPSKPAIPGNIWSPDEFELVRSRSQQQHHQRAQSSLGFASRDQYPGDKGYDAPPSPLPRDGPPELEDYVQRMERQLRHTESNASCSSDVPPQPPLKGTQFTPAFGAAHPTSSNSDSSHESSPGKPARSQSRRQALKNRKSAYELGRTYTTKTSVTNSTESSSATQSSASTQLTSRSIMSGYSAGGFSATSAGSLARRKFGLGSQRGHRPITIHDTRSMGDLTSSTRAAVASESSASGPSYHESHASHNQLPITLTEEWEADPIESAKVLGGLSAPKMKKSGFFKKMIESARMTARTGAATARSTIGSASNSRPGSRAGSPTKSLLSGHGPMAISSQTALQSSPATGKGGVTKDMGLGGGSDWMQSRRDVNRSNSLSHKEREERAERCEMLDLPALRPIDQLQELAEGDEGLDGLPVTEPTDFNTGNLSLVDKSTRFIQSVPPMITGMALAQSYICRPHRSDVQRLRAIFTWVAERITWEEDYEGQVDARRVISTRRGCSQEIAMLVREMCSAVGMYAEEVHGYLKSPGEILDLDTIARPNHWWNAVIVDGEWRIMDCALASPTNPKRSAYSSASSQTADPWYFLARPMEVCYTHIALLPEQQRIVPPVPHEILVTLPCACPTYFRNNVELAEFDTSILHLENFEMAYLHVNVPEDIECAAEVEARTFAQDADGDFFESGDIVKKKAFAQAEWAGGRKRYTIKAVLPGDEGRGVLKIYAGKRGLMHSIKDNPHSLAVALPLSHTGQNPPYDFHIRHPTPHAQRHDLYVAQPQCLKLALNNTFVFCVRQHPASLSRFSPDTWGASTSGAGRPTSPNPYARPGSAMSMVSATTGSDYSTATNNGQAQGQQPMTMAQQKPAKLAIQTPSQRIIRLTRKQELSSRGGREDDGLTTSWETVIKIGETGTWRGLVLADRSARWCVFAEWECV